MTQSACKFFYTHTYSYTTNIESTGTHTRQRARYLKTKKLKKRFVKTKRFFKEDMKEQKQGVDSRKWEPGKRMSVPWPLDFVRKDGIQNTRMSAATIDKGFKSSHRLA